MTKKIVKEEVWTKRTGWVPLHKYAHVIDPDKPLLMKQDPLIAATKKAYRASAQYRLDELLKARSKWQRRLTIAQGKLGEVEWDLRNYLAELVAEKDGRKPEGGAK